MLIKEALCFDDVLLRPKLFPGQSRNEIDLTTCISGLTLKLPIIAANMPSVCDEKMALALSKMGALGIVHRMQDIYDECLMVQRFKDDCLIESIDGKIGASIGIGPDWLKRVNSLVSAGADLICIDVAHANQPKVFEVLNDLYHNFKLPIMVGNIASPDFIEMALNTDLNGRDSFIKRVSFKVGIGGGSMCSTRINTGFGVPTLQSLIDIRERYPDVCIVSDGGHKSPGDIVKALALADAVMLGGMLAGTEEAPGEVLIHQGQKYKAYRGNASYAEKKNFLGTAQFIEGEETLSKYKGSVDVVLQKINHGIRSGLSYGGAMNLKEFKKNAEFIKITSAGYTESTPHGLYRS